MGPRAHTSPPPPPLPTFSLFRDRSHPSDILFSCFPRLFIEPLHRSLSLLSSSFSPQFSRLLLPRASYSRVSRFFPSSRLFSSSTSSALSFLSLYAFLFSWARLSSAFGISIARTFLHLSVYYRYVAIISSAGGLRLSCKLCGQMEILFEAHAGGYGRIL